MLADQWCGLELSCVRELLGYMPFQPLNGQHPAIVGSFDLRGTPACVVDFRTRFGLPTTRTDDTSMLIVDHASRCFALIVDKTVSLANLTNVATTNTLTRIEQSCVSGTATVNGRTLILLDAARALALPAPILKAA